MRFAILVLALLCCISTASRAATQPTTRPNIVLIISDDQSWTDYSFMSHPQIRTPNLDRLASQGLLYRRGYVTASLCCPSLASLITGLYPHQTKVTGNEPPVPPGVKLADRYRDPQFLLQTKRVNSYIADHPRIPDELKKLGYLSLQTGKWWAGNFSSGGFTDGMSQGDITHGGRHGDDGLKIGRQTMQPIFDFIDSAQRQQRPFFVWYAPMLPHQPHNPPARFLDHYRDKTPSVHLARYWAMCEWFDETCGQLLDYLDQQKLADNTIVVFLADNGWTQNPDAASALVSKNSPLDTGLRTPIMLRWPGHIPPRIDDTPISSIDIAPTIYGAVGLPVPKELPGINLLDSAAVRGRQAIFGACFLHNAIYIDSPGRNMTWRWCVAGQYKLIIPNSPNLDPARFKGVTMLGSLPPGPRAVRLFDLAGDPNEKNDLAAAQPQRVQDLRRLMDDWWNPQ